MPNPLVSIIIPTLNRAHLIGETLDSVLAQTYQNWECIVVDDGSTDNTAELMTDYIAKDSRFQYHRRPKDRLPGGNAARNYGFEVSNGEYINWFDSDDLMHPEKLQIQIHLLIQSQKAYCICQTLVFEEKVENIIGLRKKYIYSEDPLNDFIRSKITWLTQAPVLLKAFLISEELRFDETLRRAQEYEFFIKLLFYNPNYVHTNEPLVYLRIHGNRISSEIHSPLKLYSVFKASFNSFKLVHDSVKMETRNELFRRMINQIYLALVNNQIKLAKDMMLKFNELETSKMNKTFVGLGFYIYRFTGNKRVIRFLASKRKKTIKSFI